MNELKAMLRNVIPAAIIGMAVLVVGMSANQTFSAYTKEQLTMQKQRLMNEIVDLCSRQSTATWTDEETNVVVTEPYQKAYTQCLVDHGYEKK